MSAIPNVAYLSAAEAAAALRVSKMTVYRMVHSGEIESVRIGRSFMIIAEAFFCKFPHTARVIDPK